MLAFWNTVRPGMLAVPPAQFEVRGDHLKSFMIRRWQGHLTVIELRVAEIRLGIEVPRRFPLAKSRKDPGGLARAKSHPRSCGLLTAQPERSERMFCA